MANRREWQRSERGFGSDQGCSLAKLAATHRMTLARLGTTGGPRVSLRVDGAAVFATEAAQLKAIHAGALEAALND